MKCALFQFSVSRKIEDNYQKIKHALIEARKKGADILVTQECALSGYPPIEIDTVAEIDFEKQAVLFQKLVTLAKEHSIYLLLGLIRKDKEAVKNTIAIIHASGKVEYYDKRALWGWDADNFQTGTNNKGIFEIQGVKIGIRICFEIRFPEYFRELYKEHVDIAIVSLCDIQKNPNPERLNIIKSHLVTRAIENAFTVISVNSATQYQTAPTAVFNQEGLVCIEAEKNREALIYYTYHKQAPLFGTQGRIHYSNQLLRE